MRTHIAIATTQGPVFIQKLTPEEEDVISLVCLNETSKQLAISRAYADFVKKGSGLIERDFGHASWRLDISANIDTGDSWQLAVYLAHFYYASGSLGDGDPQPGDRVIIASGEVRITRETEPVKHLEKKSSVTESRITSWQNTGVQCCWVVSPGNLDSVDSRANKIGLANVTEIRQAVDGHPASESRVQPSLQKFKLLILTILLSAGIAVAVVLLPDDMLDDFSGKAVTGPKTSPLPPFTAQLRVVRNADPFLCGSSRDEAELLQANKESTFSPVRMQHICSIRLLHDKAYAASWLYALDSGALRELHWRGAQHAGWDIPMPEHQSADRPYLIAVFERPLNRSRMNLLKQELDDVRLKNASDRNTMQHIIEKTGTDVEVYFHSLMATH